MKLNVNSHFILLKQTIWSGIKMKADGIFECPELKT